MQIIKETGICWPERMLISRLYMDQSVKIRVDHGKTRNVKNGKGLDRNVVCHRFHSTYRANTLHMKLLKGLET